MTGERGPLSILLAVHSAQGGGAELMALAEAERLAAHHHLTISIPEGPIRSRFEPFGEIVPALPNAPVYGASAKRWSAQLVRAARQLPAFRRLLLERHIDVVITSSTAALAAVVAARTARVPVISHFRDWPASRLTGLVLFAHALCSEVVVAISAGSAALVPTRRAKVAVIHDGIAIDRSREWRDVVAGRPSPTSPITLCVVGGIDARKGQDIAVQALALLRARHYDCRLQLIGGVIDSGYAAEVSELAESLGVADLVEFVGRRNDVPALLERADLLVSCSRGEWTPLSIMEAMRVGLPVVATATGSVSEVLRHGTAGALVTSVGDPEALARSIARQIDNPNDARAMAEVAFSHVESSYDRQSTLDRLEALVLSVASS